MAQASDTPLELTTAMARRQSRELGSVGNALRMLEVLAATPEAGVSALARELNLSKASIDRLLTTLTRAGFAEQNPETRRYRLSLKIAVLAEGVRSRMTIVELARPQLKALSASIHESINLGVFLDGALVYADTIPSGHIFRIEVRPGTALPAYCTAAGKVLLAFMAKDRLDAYLSDLAPIQHTSSTLTTIPEIRAELDTIRRQGYAVDRGELLEEAWCIAAPIILDDDEAIAAVSVSAPKSHFDALRDEILTAVTAAAETISSRVATAGMAYGTASPRRDSVPLQ